jgi:hypothetical protein
MYIWAAFKGLFICGYVAFCGKQKIIVSAVYHRSLRTRGGMHLCMYACRTIKLAKNCWCFCGKFLFLFLNVTSTIIVTFGHCFLH